MIREAKEVLFAFFFCVVVIGGGGGDVCVPTWFPMGMFTYADGGHRLTLCVLLDFFLPLENLFIYVCTPNSRSEHSLQTSFHHAWPTD